MNFTMGSISQHMCITHCHTVSLKYVYFYFNYTSIKQEREPMTGYSLVKMVASILPKKKSMKRLLGTQIGGCL